MRNDLHVASIFNYFKRLSQEGAAAAGGPELRVNASVSRTPPNWWVVRRKIVIKGQDLLEAAERKLFLSNADQPPKWST